MFHVGPNFFSSPAGGLCSSFVYEFIQEFGAPNQVDWDTFPEWIIQGDWFFRVYENPVSNLDLGTPTLVTVNNEGPVSMGDICDQIESQLVGFTCFFVNANTLLNPYRSLFVISRENAPFALRDGDGTTFPTPGYNKGVFDYRLFYYEIDGDSSPISPFGEILPQDVCYVPMPR